MAVHEMKKVRQVVIAAGGRGSRISPELNPNGCKSLIEFNGKPLLEILIDALAVAGIERFILSTARHTDTLVRQMMRRKQVSSAVLPLSEMGKFRWIPYYAQDLLDDRFLFVCGHHPLPAPLFGKMLSMSETHTHVAAAYETNLFAVHRAEGLKISYDPQAKRLSDSNDGPREPGQLLIDSPYVLSKCLLAELESNPGQEYSRYVLDRQSRGEAVGVVESIYPPEFDYDDELRRTIDFLSSQL